MTPSPEREREIIAAFIAAAIMRRFDAMVGGPLACSPAVMAAASRVLDVVFGAEDDVMLALDDLETAEAAWEAS